MSAPTTPAHALLGASSARKWLNCTPSARLEATLPDTTSTYAEEGTLAHTIAELKLRKKYVDTSMTDRTFKSRMKKLTTDPLYADEMQACTDEYLDYITGVAMGYDTAPYIVTEKQVDYSRFAPEGFGTADCIIIGADTMHVIDYKHGKGVPVYAENNPQMMLYALGALEAYGMLYAINTINMAIVQPRLDSISEFSIGRGALVDWGILDVQDKAEAAFAGTGEFCPGEWCTNNFCKARFTCRARGAANTALEDFAGINAPSFSDSGKFPQPPLLSDAEVGDVLQRAIDLAKWADSLKEYALEAILNGSEIPGWKAVEGRSNRAFDDVDAAFSRVEAAGYDEALLFERKPITLTAVEKLLGKANFNTLLGEHIVKPAGKPALALASDNREAYNPKSAAGDFAEVAGADK